jgi:hypothetical protein
MPRVIAGADLDAGVGEGEQRHDHIAGPRVVEALQPLVGGQGRREAEAHRPLQFGGRLLTEEPEQAARPLQRGTARGVRGGQQPHGEADHDGVHPRLQQRHPGRDGQQRVHPAAPGAGGPYQQDHAEQAECHQQGGDVDVAAVGDGNDDQRHEVVDDGYGQDEDAQAAGQPVAEQGQHAEGERRVGRHRGAPAVGRALSGVDGQVDGDGDEHAAEPRDEGQCDAPAFAELPHVELAARLQADDEEEHGHQAAVDPLPQFQRHPGGPDTDGEVRPPEVLVRAGAEIHPGQCR